MRRPGSRIPPAMKRFSLRGLPDIIAHNQLPFPVSLLLATIFTGVVAYVFGRILMRLSGIAASIATFAMLAVINTVYSNWQSVTGATSSIVGIPMRTGIWTALAGAASGDHRRLSLFDFALGPRAARFARRRRRGERGGRRHGARATGRLRAQRRRSSASPARFTRIFSASVNPDAFYMNLTFITLSMLVVGGMNSLSGRGGRRRRAVEHHPGASLGWKRASISASRRSPSRTGSGDRDRSDHDRHPHVPPDGVDAKS